MVCRGFFIIILASISLHGYHLTLKSSRGPLQTRPLSRCSCSAGRVCPAELSAKDFATAAAAVGSLYGGGYAEGSKVSTASVIAAYFNVGNHPILPCAWETHQLMCCTGLLFRSVAIQKLGIPCFFRLFNNSNEELSQKGTHALLFCTTSPLGHR